MKQTILTLLRVALIAAPAYSLYIFATGEGADKPLSWWQGQAGYIAWALGAYVVILLSSYARRINGVQIAILWVGALGLMYFYLTPDVYEPFLGSPFFEANKKLLPVVPYVFCTLIALFSMLAKTRRG